MTYIHNYSQTSHSQNCFFYHLPLLVYLQDLPLKALPCITCYRSIAAFFIVSFPHKNQGPMKGDSFTFPCVHWWLPHIRCPIANTMKINRITSAMLIPGNKVPSLSTSGCIALQWFHPACITFHSVACTEQFSSHSCAQTA